MQGPSAATMRAGSAPSALHRRDRRLDDAGRARPSSRRARRRRRAPPASANRIMPQSAPVTPSARPGVAVTSAVAARPRVGRPGRGDRDRVGRMDLVGNRQTLRRKAERRGHAGAVLGDRLGRVARADAAVERGVDACGDAAARVKNACATPGSVERRGGQERALRSRWLRGDGLEAGRRGQRRGWPPPSP